MDNADAGGSGERHTPQITHELRNTGIAIEYGETTWRPVQSTIDLVQNHLDANTAVYEKKLLQAIGITEYNPSDTTQQTIISLLNTLKFTTTVEKEKTYEALQEITGGHTPDNESLHEQLEDITYDLPRVQLKTTDGTKTQFVPYEEMPSLPDTWQIAGFRVEDAGSGFDDELLGIMGASTRNQSSGKRGGLGEGLKMSATHLVRSGADVRLLSRNEDALWIARPAVTEGQVGFNLVKQQKTNPEVTGSVTDVDFSNDAFDPALRKEIVDTLDPRKGEGLGKYVLEFRGEQFIPIINDSTEVSSLDVPAGRVYVKGLLVEEAAKTLWSYNLSEKWAISGRDRKTVKQDLLLQDIQTIVTSLDDQARVNEIVGLIKSTGEYLETKVLTEALPIDDEKKQLWQQALTDVFNFKLGETIFAPDNLPSEQRRFVEQRGLRIITIPPKNTQAIALFKKLYPDAMISFDQMTVSDKENLPLDTETEKIVNECRDIFKKIVKEDSITDLLSGILNRMNLEAIGFAKAREDTLFESDTQFAYDPTSKLIYVRGDVQSKDFKTITDISVQFLKVLTGKETFDKASQAQLTKFAGNAVKNSRPEMLNELDISTESTISAIDVGKTYPTEQRDADNKVIYFLATLDKLNTPNLSQTDFERTLDDLRKLKSQLTTDIKRIDRINGYFYFDEKLYRFNPHDLSLQEEKLNKNSLAEYGDGTDLSALFSLLQISLLPPNETEYHLKKAQRAYLPFQLDDGESMSITTNDNKEMVIKRKGKRVFVIYTKDGKKRISQGEQIKLSDMLVTSGANGLHIKASENETLTIDKDNIISDDELSEKNEGKDFIQANITIDYGGDVWRDPRRMLIDAIQNHIDAQHGDIPNIVYTIKNAEGNTEEVTQEALQTRDSSWKIIGMTISDTGQGYPTPYLTRLGASTKEDTDLGKFGEGLKMLAASAVKQGINISFGSREWVAKPTVYERKIKDYEANEEKTFEMLGYHMQWIDQPQTGSYTNFSLTDETRGTTWGAWTDILDPRNVNQYGQHGLERYILPKEDRQYTDGIVTILPDRPGDVYEKALLIPGKNNKPKMFGYNVDETIIDTRERNTYSQELLDDYVSEYFHTLTDKDIMRQILETAKEHPDVDYYEFQFFRRDLVSEESKLIWKQTFYDVFGDDAVLSLRSELNLLKTRPDRLSLAGSQATIEEAVAKESHLEDANLQKLPTALTRLLLGRVYISKNYVEALQGVDVELSTEDRQALVEFVQTTNQTILTILDSLDSKPQSKAYLATIVSPEALEERKRNLAEITAENIRVKNPSSPALGRVQNIDGEPSISLNQTLLSIPLKLVQTYTHEAGHYLSRKGDYTLDFQRFLMAIALSQLEWVS